MSSINQNHNYNLLLNKIHSVPFEILDITEDDMHNKDKFYNMFKDIIIDVHVDGYSNQDEYSDQDENSSNENENSTNAAMENSNNAPIVYNNIQNNINSNENTENINDSENNGRMILKLTLDDLLKNGNDRILKYNGAKYYFTDNISYVEVNRSAGNDILFFNNIKKFTQYIYILQ